MSMKRVAKHLPNLEPTNHNPKVCVWLGEGEHG